MAIWWKCLQHLEANVTNPWPIWKAETIWACWAVPLRNLAKGLEVLACKLAKSVEAYGSRARWTENTSALKIEKKFLLIIHQNRCIDKSCSSYIRIHTVLVQGTKLGKDQPFKANISQIQILVFFCALSFFFYVKVMSAIVKDNSISLSKCSRMFSKLCRSCLKVTFNLLLLSHWAEHNRLPDNKWIKILCQLIKNIKSLRIFCLGFKKFKLCLAMAKTKDIIPRPRFIYYPLVRFDGDLKLNFSQ